MSQDLLDKQVIMRILSEMEKSEERDRRTHSFDAYQIYSGNQANYVEQMIMAKRPKSYQGYITSDISIARMVTKKRSQSYLLPPSRETENDELMEEIYKGAMADRSFQAFDEGFNLHKHMIMWVNYVQEEERIQFMPLHPYEFSLVRDKDSGEVEIVILNYPNRDLTANANSGDGLSDLISESQADSSANGNHYVFWSKDQVVKVFIKNTEVTIDGKNELKTDVTYVPIEGNPKSVNPIGMLPFVYLSDDLSVDMPTPNPLANQSVSWNYQWSEVLTSSNIQGSGQFVLRYPESMQGNMDKINIGLLSAVELPQKEDPNMPSTEAEYISPSPDLASQREISMTYLKMILKEHGIDGENMELGESSAVSGISKAISGSNVQKIISNNQMMYERVEQACFEIVKAWVNEAQIAGKSFGQDDGLVVIYPKPKVLMSDKETLDVIEKKLELGLIEKWEALVALDPNLTEENAKDKLNQIQLERNDNMRSVLGVGIQRESSEQNGQTGS